MKIVELTNKVLLPITNEEKDLLEKFSDQPIAKSQLDEREQVIANHLTVKDILLRSNDQGKIYYKKRIG
jgi:hypothetical protein